MSLAEAKKEVEKQFGVDTVRRLGDHEPVKIDSISTGVLSLDKALEIGGFPKGRVVEVFGPESSGKTTLTLLTIAEAQKTGGICLYLDAEHAFSLEWAAKLGVKTDDLLVNQPDYGEQALEIAEKYISSGDIAIVVVDSVAALTPKSEIEGDFGDAQMGLQGRMMSQAMRKLTAVVHKSNTILIFINQLRSKIGVMFGNPETTTGGNALKFYASVRLDIRRIATIKDGDKAIGARTRIKVVKSKVSTPFREVETDLLFGSGFSREGDILDLGVNYGIIEKSGAWVSFEGERIGQGRDNAREFLKSNPGVADKIVAKIRAAK